MRLPSCAGKMTGLVVDIGDGVTHIIPVIEGCSFPHLTRRSPLIALMPTLMHTMRSLELSMTLNVLQEHT